MVSATSTFFASQHSNSPMNTHSSHSPLANRLGSTSLSPTSMLWTRRTSLSSIPRNIFMDCIFAWGRVRSKGMGISRRRRHFRMAIKSDGVRSVGHTKVSGMWMLVSRSFKSETRASFFRFMDVMPVGTKLRSSRPGVDSLGCLAASAKPNKARRFLPDRVVTSPFVTCSQIRYFIPINSLLT